jgi:hypothetical protein
MGGSEATFTLRGEREEISAVAVISRDRPRAGPARMREIEAGTLALLGEPLP